MADIGIDIRKWDRFGAIRWRPERAFCGWFAANKGRILCYREAAIEGPTPIRVAEALTRATPEGETVRVWWSGPALFDVDREKRAHSRCVADVLRQRRVFCEMVEEDPLGWGRVRDYLLPMPDGMPRLLFRRSCLECVESLPAAVEADGGAPETADAAWMVFYAVASRPAHETVEVDPKLAAEAKRAEQLRKHFPDWGKTKKPTRQGAGY